MKNILKTSILCFIIAGLSLIMPGLMDSTRYDVQAGEADWSDDGSESGAVDPFTVVQIAPYRGMNEIGYLVGGQEPINQELMDYGSAGGAVSFLGGAIDVYRSYEEKPLPASLTADSGWVPVRSELLQNGYFEYVGYNNGGFYSLDNGTNYLRVADGTGNYAAVLSDGTDMEDTYSSYDPTNRRNVNCHFVLGKPTGVAIFNASYSYVPYSVTANPTHNGDYDYDVSTKSFYLNEGNGKYDVIFVRGTSGNLYYIIKDSIRIVEDGSGDYSFPLTYVSQAGGNYIRQNGQYMTFNRWSGTYRFVQDDTALSKSNFLTEGSRIWVINQKITKLNQYHYKVQLVNNEWFKTKTLGVPASRVEDYPVQVITITPDDLNKPENQHYIDEADLFYINASYSHNPNYIMLYENYSYEGLALPASEKYDTGTKDKSSNLNFAVHDLSWDSVLKIFKRAAGIGCNKAAMIYDITFYLDAMNGSGSYGPLQRTVTVPYTGKGNKASICNVAKLYIMTYQRNMIDFYNAFLQTENPAIQTRLITKVASTVNKTGSTGSFVRPDMGSLSASADAAIYWNGDTFLPFGLDASGNMISYTSTTDMVSHGVVNYNITANTTDLTNNVLTLNGMDIFTAKFVQPLSVPSDSQEEAVVHLSSENPDGTLVNPSTINIGNLVDVVTNEGTGFENTGGVSYPPGSTVEGPPADTPEEDAGDTTDDGLDGSGLRSYKRVLNIQPTADFTTSDAEIRTILAGLEVQIVNMTSMQFNSSIEDINSRYDMIFMGSSAGRFNWTTGTSPTTSFNNGTYNGNYYFTTGDTRLIKTNNREIEYYRGNDITTQKVTELNSYLDAGFPIVVDSKLYTKTGIGYATNLPAFITSAINNHLHNFLNAADNSSTTTTTKLNFKSWLTAALNVTRPHISLITPIVPEGSLVNYLYVDPVTDLLTVKFSLLPKGKYPSTYTYNAYLFLDENRDGIFDATERLNAKPSDGSSNEGLRENKNFTYTYNYNIAGYNGVYQWKLEVRRTDNSNNIRSIITGYTANTNKETINILHIRDNSSTYSLETKINDAASLIYRYAGGSALSDYQLNIKSMTVDQFQQLYASKPYTTATAATTNKLTGYHMLILDNPVNVISNTYGARTNIYDEASKKLCIIYTKNALNYDNQGYYSTKTSLQYELTYNYLNFYAFIKPKNTLYIYNSLNTNGNGNMTDINNYRTTYLTKTNEGTITRYPYQINPALLSSANYYSDYVTKDFNLTNQRLIGWYCLSDIKDPLVRSTFNTGVADADLYEGMYSSSPNDVKNNYYLFNYGLNYYSGITLATADVTGNDEEMKLFINTIIAAYEASGRVVSTPAVITIKNASLVVAPDSTKSITVTEAEIVSGNFILTFEISQSSSNMDLTVLLNGAEPAGSWDDVIYEVTGGVAGPPIAVDNTSKVVGNHIYQLKIPLTAISGTPKVLTLSVVNGQGNITTEQVTLTYVQKPVVTLKDDPKLIKNTTKTYMYTDIDFNSLDTNEDYLNSAEAFSVPFNVDKSMTAFTLGATSETENLTDGTGYDVTFTKADGTPITSANNNGDYIIYIPAALMKDHNSREITITATDTAGNSGQASITLIRRSLFPLD